MSTLLHSPKHLLQVCLFLLLVSSCVKEPGPDIPGPVHKPALLLAKISEVTAYGDAVLEQPRFEKHVIAFTYNKFYKPSLQLTYYSQIEGDTTSLLLSRKDTFYYDRHLRVTQRRTMDRNNKPSVLQKFLYAGNDTLPATYERYYYDSTGNPRLYYSWHYTYLGDTAVLATASGSKGDTSKYIYHQGNYVSYCYRRGTGTFQCGTVYNDYAGRNVFLFLNISHMIGLEFPGIYSGYGYIDGPRISRQNWQLLDGPYHRRSLVFDANGLLSKAILINFYPESRTTTDFEYIQPE